jgi:hypothetical protein
MYLGTLQATFDPVGIDVTLADAYRECERYRKAMTTADGQKAIAVARKDLERLVRGEGVYVLYFGLIPHTGQSLRLLYKIDSY